MTRKLIICAFVAVVIAAVMVQESQALHIKLKKLAAIGILAKALRPSFLPLPLPIPIAHHKEIHPKPYPVHVPYPVHHYHKEHTFELGHGGGHGGGEGWW